MLRHEEARGHGVHRGQGVIDSSSSHPCTLAPLPPCPCVPYLYRILQLPSELTMHGPTGLWGLHFLPNSGHFSGSMIPLSTSPQRQPLGSGNLASLRSLKSPSNLLRASHFSNPALILRPLPGIWGKPRHSTSQGSKTAPMASLALTFPSGLTTRAYSFSNSALPSFFWRASM